MEEKRGEERGALSDSRGEGSDVISTSVILLSQSILCLFVFNILSPPYLGVCVCVCVKEGEREREERWKADYQMARECVVSLLAAHVLRLGLFFWRGVEGGNTGINCCIYFYLCA